MACYPGVALCFSRANLPAQRPTAGRESAAPRSAGTALEPARTRIQRGRLRCARDAGHRSAAGCGWS